MENFLEWYFSLCPKAYIWQTAGQLARDYARTGEKPTVKTVGRWLRRACQAGVVEQWAVDDSRISGKKILYRSLR